MVKKFWRYVYSYWHDPRTWQTDRQTDGQTDAAWRHRARLCRASCGKNVAEVTYEWRSTDWASALAHSPGYSCKYTDCHWKICEKEKNAFYTSLSETLCNLFTTAAIRLLLMLAIPLHFLLMCCLCSYVYGHWTVCMRDLLPFLTLQEKRIYIDSDVSWGHTSWRPSRVFIFTVVKNLALYKKDAWSRFAFTV